MSPRIYPGPVSNPERPGSLNVGEGPLERAGTNSSGIPVSSGTVRLAYFTARKTETVASIRVLGGSTAAAATPSLVRLGVYEVAENGDLALVAATANDTSLFSVASTGYTRALTAPFEKLAGKTYALAWLVVTSVGTPTLSGLNSGVTPAEMAQSPRLAGSRTGQTDLPATIPLANVGVTSFVPYGVLLP